MFSARHENCPREDPASALNWMRQDALDGMERNCRSFQRKNALSMGSVMTRLALHLLLSPSSISLSRQKTMIETRRSPGSSLTREQNLIAFIPDPYSAVRMRSAFSLRWMLTASSLVYAVKTSAPSGPSHSSASSLCFTWSVIMIFFKSRLLPRHNRDCLAPVRQEQYQ